MNELIETGDKVSAAEKKLGFGDGQARKKLSKAGYKFDRSVNKYVLKDNTITGSNAVMHHQEQSPRQNQKEAVVYKQAFTEEQVDILQQMISEYIVRQEIQANAEIDKGKTINRNVRVYEKQFEVFANWCKVNNVTQADALYKAISLLMK